MKKTLIAVGVFAVLLVLVLATREKQVNVGVPKLELPSMDKAKVVSLEVSGPSSASLKKEGGAWSVADPKKPEKKYPAEESQVGSALDALAGLKARDFVTEKAEKHAELELDEAKGLKVKVGQEDGKSLELVFGKGAKSGGVYLRRPGSNAVFVTPSGFPWQVKKDASGWRKRQVVSAKAEEMEKLQVSLEDGSSLALKQEAGAWSPGSALPAGFRFDPEAARRIAQQLASLSAQDFVEEGKKDEELGLAGPHATVEAGLKDGKGLKLHLGKAKEPNGPVPARLEGDSQAYLLPSWSAQALLKRLDDLRDLSLFSFEVSKANRVVINAGGKRTVAAKEGGAWKVLEPKTLPTGFEFEPAQVDVQLGMIRGVRGLRVVSGVKDAKAGLAKPAASVEVSLEGGGTQSLRLGSELTGPSGGKEIYAKGAADGLLYAMDTYLKSRLESGVELFRKPPPPPDFSQMRGLEQLPPDVRQKLEAQLRQQR